MPSAIVTGAGSGIGRATAMALAARGVDVVLVGRVEAPLRDAEREVAATGRRAIVVTVDVSAAGDVDAMAAAAVSRLGTPSIVVNAAGVAGRVARVADLTEADWDAVLDINLKGVFL